MGDFARDAIIQRPRLSMLDGTSLSAQANQFVYCSPRNNQGPYETVEAGFPSAKIEEILPWAEEQDDPTGTVYPRVPIEAVAFAILARGGRADAPEDWIPQNIGGAQLALPDGFDQFRDRSSVDVSEGLSGLRSAFSEWVQCAVLGSPVEERAAQFDLRSGTVLVSSWEELTEQLLAEQNPTGDIAFSHALGKALSQAEQSIMDACSAPGSPSKRASL